MKSLTRALYGACFCLLFIGSIGVGASLAADSSVESPGPLLKKGLPPVDWWFVFKFNTAAFPGCSGGAERQCIFGGEPQDYPKQGFGQQYVYASSENPALEQGSDCAGDTTTDPIGATFNQVYNGSYYYVIWNDQFYDDPKIAGCTKDCGGPWGHSKGMLAWDRTGAGVVMQVTTPSWPASGNKDHPRKSDGNTLGCVTDDNVKVSQHFFALKLTVTDVVKVLNALSNASVVTDPTNPQIVNNGGPQQIQDLVGRLGKKSSSTTYTKEILSSSVELISKPSHLNVPPWQLISYVLGRVPLRAATWWADPGKIYTTTADADVGCWDPSLKDHPGAVQIATTGQWQGKKFGLNGGPGTNSNHAKIGVSMSGDAPYVIFGDENQQGLLTGPGCSKSQNGRGGLFYVITDPKLHTAVSELIKGDSAPMNAPSSEVSESARRK